MSYEDAYLLVYTSIFSVLIDLLFTRRKEQTFNALLLQNQQLSESQQAIRQELADNLTYREELLKELQPDEVALFDDITTAYTQQAIYRITDYMRLEVTPIQLNLQKIIKDLYQPDSNSFLVKKYTKQTTIEPDFTQLKQLLVNAIRYIHLHNKDHHSITITPEDTQLGHSVAHMPGYTRTLDALKITITSENTLPPAQSLYRLDAVSTNTWISVLQDEFPLLENARILDAHYGYCVPFNTIHRNPKEFI